MFRWSDAANYECWAFAIWVNGAVLGQVVDDSCAPAIPSGRAILVQSSGGFKVFAPKAIVQLAHVFLKRIARPGAALLRSAHNHYAKLGN